MERIQQREASIKETHGKAKSHVAADIQNIRNINQHDSSMNMPPKGKQELKKLLTIKQSIIRLILSFPSQQIPVFFLQWNRQQRSRIMGIYQRQILPYFGYSYSEIGTQSKNEYSLINIIQILHMLSFRVQVPVSQEQVKEVKPQLLHLIQSTKGLFQDNTRLPYVGRAYYISSFVFNKVSVRAQEIQQNFMQANHKQVQTLCFLLSLSIQFYICCLHYQIWAYLLGLYQDQSQENTQFQISLKFQTDLFVELCLKQQSFWKIMTSTLTSSDDISMFQLVLSGQNDKQTRQFLRSFKMYVGLYEMGASSQTSKAALHQMAKKAQRFMLKKIENQKSDIKKSVQALKAIITQLKQTQITLKSDKNFLQGQHPNRRSQIVQSRLNQVMQKVSPSQKKKQENLLQAIFQIKKRKRHRYVSQKILQSVMFSLDQISLCLVATVPKILHKTDKINFLMRSILENVDVQRKFMSTGIYQQLATNQQEALVKLIQKDQKKNFYSANHGLISLTNDMLVFLQKQPQKSSFVDLQGIKNKIQFNQSILIGSKVFDKNIAQIIKNSMKNVMQKSASSDFQTILKRINQQATQQFQKTLAQAIDKHLSENFPPLKENNSAINIKQVIQSFKKSKQIQKMIFMGLIQQSIVANLRAVLQTQQAEAKKLKIHVKGVPITSEQLQSFIQSSLGDVVNGLRALVETKLRPDGLQQNMLSIITYTRSIVRSLGDDNLEFTQNIKKQLNIVYKRIKKQMQPDPKGLRQFKFLSRKGDQISKAKKEIQQQIQGRKVGQRVDIDFDPKINIQAIKQNFAMDQQKAPKDLDELKEAVVRLDQGAKAANQAKKKKKQQQKKLKQQKSKEQTKQNEQNENDTLSDQQLLKKHQKEQLYQATGKTSLMTNTASQSQLRQVLEILQNLTPFSQKQNLNLLRESIQKKDQQMIKNVLWKGQVKFEQHLRSHQFSVVVELQYLIMHAYLQKIAKMQQVQLRTSYISQIRNHAETTQSSLNQAMQRVKQTEQKIKELVKKNQKDYEMIQKKRAIRNQYQNSSEKLHMKGISLYNIINNADQAQGIVEKSLNFIYKIVQKATVTATVRSRTAYIRALETEIQSLQNFTRELDKIQIENRGNIESKRVQNAREAVQQIVKEQKSIQKQLSMYNFSSMLNLEQVNDVKLMILQTMPDLQASKIQQILRARQRQMSERQQQLKKKRQLQNQTIKRQKQLIEAKTSLQNQQMRANYDLYHKIQRDLRVQKARQKKQMIQQQIKQKKQLLQAKNSQLKQRIDNSEKVIANVLALKHRPEQFQTTAKKLYMFVVKKPVIFQLIIRRSWGTAIKLSKTQSYYFNRFMEYVNQNARVQQNQFLKNIADLDKEHTIVQSKYIQKTEMIKSQQANITLMINQVHQRIIQIQRLKDGIKGDTYQIFAAKQRYIDLSVKLNLFLHQKKQAILQKDIKTLQKVIQQAIQKRQSIIQKIQIMFSLKQLYQEHQNLINQSDAQNPRLVQIRQRISSVRQQVMKTREFMKNELDPIYEQIKIKVNSAITLISQQQKKKKKMLSQKVQYAYKVLTQRINGLFKTQQLMTQEMIAQHSTKMTTQILTDFYQKQRIQRLKADGKNLASTINSKLRTMKQQLVQIQQRQVLLDSLAQSFKKKLQGYRTSYLLSASITKEQGDGFLEQLMALIKMNDKQVSKKIEQYDYALYGAKDDG